MGREGTVGVVVQMPGAKICDVPYTTCGQRVGLTAVAAVCGT